MNYERLYSYRFRGIDQSARSAVWASIAPFIHARLGRPEVVLDPAAGRCEFINAVPAQERWAVDRVAFPEGTAAPGVTVRAGDILDVPLPAAHFDGVFVSNFLEHLSSPEAISVVLERLHAAMAIRGRIAVMGPNIRYCLDEYWDCADHVLGLTHVAIAEHLYAAGFHVTEVVPRFLPYSFRGRLPASARLTSLYLSSPPLWRLLGKQFLVLGER